MGFLKKHRFKIVITSLILILMIVSFYMLWVHVPYIKQQNQLNNIQNEIVKENTYKEVTYFNEYTSDQTYYIIRAKKDDKQQYFVFDEKKKIVDSYDGDIVSEESIMHAFEEEYHKKATTIEIGYDDQRFIYCVTYKEKDSLWYIYYNMDDGHWIRRIRLG